MAIENVFSWSKSRNEQFLECRRQYFYDRYASWGGWDRTAPPRTRLAYVLKNLKNRWAWKGETVHHVLEEVLKSLKAGRPIPLETALSHFTRTMRADYLASKAKKYIEDPKKFLGLFEHEYEKTVADDVWKKIHDGAAACIRNFYGSKTYEDLAADDKREWLVIEDLEEFDFEGSKIFVKLDFARYHEGRLEIYDWKTGKNNGDDVLIQIGTYAMFAMKKWGVAAGDIRAYLLNLGVEAPVPQSQPVTETLLEETRSAIRSSIGRMRELLADPARNIPRAEEDFRYTENPALCDFCNFYKICAKYQPITS